MYIREGLIAKRRIDLEIAELESLCVEIITKISKIILSCFYRPPNAPVSSWDNFDSLICNVIDTDCNVVVLGDINCNLLNTNPSSKESRICDKYDIVNVVSEATRVTSYSSSLLNPIFFNNLSILRNSFVLPNFCSDHSPSIVEINFSIPREKAYSKVFWEYNNADYTSIKSHLHEIDWHDKFGNSDDVNELNEIFNHEVRHVRDTFVPEKHILVRPRDKPWISSNIKQKIRKRNRLKKG